MAEKQKQQTEKLTLDRTFTYQGQHYGPGEVDVPTEVVVGKDADGDNVTLTPAADIRAAQERAIKEDVAAGRKNDPDVHMVRPEAVGGGHPAGVLQVPHPQQPGGAKRAATDGDGGEGDLDSLTVAELHDRAKAAGIEGQSSMNKAELVDALSKQQK